jgi:hypothetical protein
MKFIINSVGFHILALLLFALIYYSLPNGHFILPPDAKRDLFLLDFFNLSTTIQAGVGITQIIPATSLAQTVMSCQQLILIIGNVSILNHLIYYL